MLRPLIPGLLLLAAVVATPGFAQKKEDFQALQRDVALTQADVAAAKRSLEEKLDAVTGMLQQLMDASAKNTAAITALEQHVNTQLSEQQKSLVAPVAEVGAKVNSLTDEFQFVRESVASVDSKMSKLSTQIVDLNNTVQVLHTPPPPPEDPAGSAAVSGPPPGISADTLYNDARRDMSTGKNDIAMQEFQNYLQWFPETDYAPNAQFYIGNIQFNLNNFQEALKAFDLILANYPESANKIADAMYMRGRTLGQLGDKKAAADQYNQFLAKFPPRHELTPKVKAELAALSPAPATRRRR